MNISFVSSEKFLYGAKVMLISFLENNDFEEHNIFWLYNNVEYNAIKDFCDFFLLKYNQIITPFELTDEMLNNFQKNKTFGIAAFHKLFVFGLLPIKCDRILSLDADAIVDASLKDFYYQDMDNYCIASSQDLHITAEELRKKGYKKGEYVNLGNTLFNLENYLKAYSVEEYVKYVEENEEILNYVAQDVVNNLLKDKIKHCDAYVFNLQVFSRLVIDRRVSRVERKRIKLAFKNKPKIIHYVRNVKPWDLEYRLGYGKYFKKYEKTLYTNSQWKKLQMKRFTAMAKEEIVLNLNRFKRLLNGTK